MHKLLICIHQMDVCTTCLADFVTTVIFLFGLGELTTALGPKKNDLKSEEAGRRGEYR